MRYQDKLGIVYYVAPIKKPEYDKPHYTIYCKVPGRKAEVYTALYSHEEMAIKELEECAQRNKWQRIE